MNDVSDATQVPSASTAPLSPTPPAPPAQPEVPVPAAPVVAPAAAPAPVVPDAVPTPAQSAAPTTPADHAATFVKELSEEAQRYPMLVTLSSILRLSAIIVGAILVVIAFVMLFVAEGWGQKILYFFIALSLAFFYAVIFIALSEGIKLAMDVEKNTRKAAERK